MGLREGHAAVMTSELASDMMLSIYLIGGGGGTQNYKVVKNKKGKSVRKEF